MSWDGSRYLMSDGSRAILDDGSADTCGACCGSTPPPVACTTTLATADGYTLDFMTDNSTYLARIQLLKQNQNGFSGGPDDCYGGSSYTSIYGYNPVSMYVAVSGNVLLTADAGLTGYKLVVFATNGPGPIGGTQLACLTAGGTASIAVTAGQIIYMVPSTGPATCAVATCGAVSLGTAGTTSCGSRACSELNPGITPTPASGTFHIDTTTIVTSGSAPGTLVACDGSELYTSPIPVNDGGFGSGPTFGPGGRYYGNATVPGEGVAADHFVCIDGYKTQIVLLWNVFRCQWEALIYYVDASANRTFLGRFVGGTNWGDPTGDMLTDGTGYFGGTGSKIQVSV